jgi:hypothetical protein
LDTEKIKMEEEKEKKYAAQMKAQSQFGRNFK